MGITISILATCDKCSAQTTGTMVLSKLKPSVDAFLRLPQGWQCTHKLDSREIFIKCPSCPTDTVSLIPTTAALTFDEIDNPTLRPPPKKKRGG